MLEKERKTPSFWGNGGLGSIFIVIDFLIDFSDFVSFWLCFR